MKTIKLNSVLNAFVNYNVVDPTTFEVLNNDWMPQTVFNDIERLASYGIQVLDDNNHVIVATEKTEEEPKKKVKKQAKTKKVEKTEEERKQDNIKALESRIETAEEQTEEKEVQKEEETEVEQQEFDLDSTPEEILIEIEKAAKAKPNTIKLLEKYAGMTVSEYDYDRSAHLITIELEDGKIFEASNKAELLEDVYLAYSQK